MTDCVTCSPLAVCTYGGTDGTYAVGVAEEGVQCQIAFAAYRTGKLASKAFALGLLVALYSSDRMPLRKGYSSMRAPSANTTMSKDTVSVTRVIAGGSHGIKVIGPLMKRTTA